MPFGLKQAQSIPSPPPPPTRIGILTPRDSLIVLPSHSNKKKNYGVIGCLHVEVISVV